MIGPTRTTDIDSKLDTLIEAMSSRGSIKHHLTVKDGHSALAIANCSHRPEEDSTNSAERTSLVTDGPVSADLQVEEIGGQIESASLSETLETGRPFSFLAISGGRLLAGRDPLGQKPIYVGTNEDGTVAIASLRSALDKIGILNSQPLSPGQIVSYSTHGVSVISESSLSKPKTIDVSESEATKRLSDLLIQSLEDATSGNYAVAFSGGIDSTLVAQAARFNDGTPELITVSMKGQSEIEHARKVSKHLKLDLTVRELSTEEVLEAVPDVMTIVESEDPIIVGVSLPLYFACETAEEMGIREILAGQLSDELFAGYGRFDQLALENNQDETADEIWKSVLAASTNDFEPGDKLAVSHKMELRCPFAFFPLVKFALQLPITLKLRVDRGGVVRKFILRRLASDWNLPHTVVEKPKKAVQYSTGVQKVLLKAARKNNISLANYLKSLRSNS